MTGIEKRAHDLALLYIKELITKKIIEIDSMAELDISLYIDEYLKIYSAILADLNQRPL